jgi:hypothetical protein
LLRVFTTFFDDQPRCTFHCLPGGDAVFLLLGAPGFADSVALDLWIPKGTHGFPMVKLIIFPGQRVAIWVGYTISDTAASHEKTCGRFGSCVPMFIVVIGFV